MSKGNQKNKAVIEALLFAWGDPLGISDISKILEVTRNEAEYLLNELMDDMKHDGRGLIINRVKNRYQIGTKPEFHEHIKALNKPIGGKNLSNAALETLSIIAYKQPVIKADIEAIRGVKSDSAIYTLLDKNLIEERGRLERIGRPIIYGTTDIFLKNFGLESIDSLPALKENIILDEEEIKENMEEED